MQGKEENQKKGNLERRFYQQRFFPTAEKTGLTDYRSVIQYIYDAGTFGYGMGEVEPPKSKSQDQEKATSGSLAKETLRLRNTAVLNLKLKQKIFAYEKDKLSKLRVILPPDPQVTPPEETTDLPEDKSPKFFFNLLKPKILKGIKSKLPGPKPSPAPSTSPGGAGVPSPTGPLVVPGVGQGQGQGQRQGQFEGLINIIGGLIGGAAGLIRPILVPDVVGAERFSETDALVEEIEKTQTRPEQEGRRLPEEEGRGRGRGRSTEVGGGDIDESRGGTGVADPDAPGSTRSGSTPGGADGPSRPRTLGEMIFGEDLFDFKDQYKDAVGGFKEGAPNDPMVGKELYDRIINNNFDTPDLKSRFKFDASNKIVPFDKFPRGLTGFGEEILFYRELTNELNLRAYEDAQFDQRFDEPGDSPYADKAPGQLLEDLVGKPPEGPKAKIIGALEGADDLVTKIGRFSNTKVGKTGFIGLDIALSGLDYQLRLNAGQSHGQAASGVISSNAAGALSAAGMAKFASPLLVTPVPGARVLYGGLVLGAGIAGGIGGGYASDKIWESITFGGGKIKADSVFDTGLVTGPEQFIGMTPTSNGQNSYHIDAKFNRQLNDTQLLMLFDNMAAGYAAKGRKIEFSNAGVAGEVYDLNAKAEDRLALLKKVFLSHDQKDMRTKGYMNDAEYSADFYVPKVEEDRWGASAQGAPLFAPSIDGGTVEYLSGGGYGAYAQIKDPEGNTVIRIGHGDVRSAPPSGTKYRFKDKELLPFRKIGQPATLNGKPVKWDGEKWIPDEEKVSLAPEPINKDTVVEQDPLVDEDLKIGSLFPQLMESQTQFIPFPMPPEKEIAYVPLQNTPAWGNQSVLGG